MRSSVMNSPTGSPTMMMMSHSLSSWFEFDSFVGLVVFVSLFSFCETSLEFSFFGGKQKAFPEKPDDARHLLFSFAKLSHHHPQTAEHQQHHNMSTLLWIIIFGFLMSCIALVGSLTLIFPQLLVERNLLALVSFAAGSLLGGSILHMIPAAVEKMGNTTELYVWLIAGFVLFLALEQFLSWHHSHTHSHSCSLCRASHRHDMPRGCVVDITREEQCLGRKNEGFPNDTNSSQVDDDDMPVVAKTGDCKTTLPASSQASSSQDDERQEQDDIESFNNNESPPQPTSSPQQDHPTKQPLTYLILVADAVHNFVGGLFVGASFVDSVSLGLSAWIAAAAHEVPQELGDFAILLHGGWSKKSALFWNFASALTFPLGGLITYLTSKRMDVSFLMPFAAGNFLYISATDLIPEIKHYHGIQSNLLYFFSFVLGITLLLVIRIVVDGW